MSGRGRSPKRQTIHARDENDELYGRHSKLITAVVTGIELFSRSVDSSVIATLLPESSNSRDYLKFAIEGTVKNSDTFLVFIEQEGGFTNTAFFSFDHEQTARGPVQRVVLNVAKKAKEPVAKTGLLTTNVLLLLLFVAMLALGYSFG
jgi:hypothetical protein